MVSFVLKCRINDEKKIVKYFHPKVVLEELRTFFVLIENDPYLVG